MTINLLLMKRYLNLMFLIFILGCKNTGNYNKTHEDIYIHFPKELVQLYDTIRLDSYMKDSTYKILTIINGGCDCALSFLQEFNVFINNNKLNRVKNCIIVQGHSFVSFDNLMLHRNMYKNLSFFKDTKGVFLNINTIQYEANLLYLLDNNNKVIFYGKPIDNSTDKKKFHQLLNLMSD